MSSFTRLFLSFLVSAFLWSNVYAGTFTYYYEAIITEPGPTNLKVGDKFSGYYKMDDTTLLEEPPSTQWDFFGTFTGPVAQHTYPNGWGQYGGNYRNVAQVRENELSTNNEGTTTTDRLVLYSETVPSNQYAWIWLDLKDTNSTVTNSRTLPTASFNEYEQADFHLRFGTDGPWGNCDWNRAAPECFANGTVTKLTVLTDLTVALDIKPGSVDNQFYPASPARLSVAILSTPAFDATTAINISTVRFGATGHEAASTGQSINDINGDGINDLVMQFVVTATGLSCQSTNATLTGATNARESFKGTDTVKPIGCTAPPRPPRPT